MANSNSLFESLRNLSHSPRKRIFREIFLFHHEIVCCVYSLESPDRVDSDEYAQHTIIVWTIEKKNKQTNKKTNKQKKKKKKQQL